MQSKATTVAKYLAQLPSDRRQVIAAVRQVILENLDAGFEEGMQYGMIGYYVPHRIYPAGYHCDPKQPFPFAGLAAQKNHNAVYLMCYYADGEIRRWFDAAWKQAGKKLDMGKCCLRFQKLDDLALDVLGDLFRRVTAKKYLAQIQTALAQRSQAGKSAPRQSPVKKAAVSKRAVGKKQKGRASARTKQAGAKSRRK